MKISFNSTNTENTMTIQEKVYFHTQTLCNTLYNKSRANFNHYRFSIETGKKYLKIVSVSYGDNKSVHAFVDKNTGDLYKASSWKAPAKGVRFNLMNDDSRNLCYDRCDVYGSYLYLR